jgi:SsrA-binding protein
MKKQIITKNKRAHFDYFIEEVFEAGIALAGSEVKSLRTGKSNITESYAEIANNEVFLINSYIAEYSGANRFNHETRRHRKLLLKKREIKKLIGATQKKGYAIIPICLFFNEKGRVKIEIGLGKGKKLYDKRADKKEKDWNKDKARVLKDFNQ